MLRVGEPHERFLKPQGEKNETMRGEVKVWYAIQRGVGFMVRVFW